MKQKKDPFALRADAILDSFHDKQTVQLQVLEETAVGTPVTMRGIFVGMGKVYHNGVLVIETDVSRQGRELRKMLLEGTANCIAIGPNDKSPIVPTATIAPKN